METTRQLKTLLSNLPGMAYRYLNDNHWTMEFVSEGCTKLTGYTPDELIGNRTISYNSLILPDDRDRVKEEVEASLGEMRHFEVKYRITTRDDHIRWLWERGIAVPCPPTGTRERYRGLYYRYHGDEKCRKKTHRKGKKPSQTQGTAGRRNDLSSGRDQGTKQFWGDHLPQRLVLDGTKGR
ncbi:MAG: PAS domain-containing protein [Chitinivibrionales bacterium]|nr:PAS domain-containing protein [Chitinivibrionales bacterium]